jgi:hypothetical protein
MNGVRINVYNNTVWNIGTSSWSDSPIWVDGSVGQTLDSIATFNNIIGPSLGSYRRTFEFAANAAYTNRISNNNLFYDSSGIILLVGTSTHTTLASYKAAVAPQDSSSLNSNPLFVNLAGNNFSLQPASPAINAGANLGSPYNLRLVWTSVWPASVVTADQNTDGSGLEIGAYVYVGASPPVLEAFPH